MTDRVKPIAIKRLCFAGMMLASMLAGAEQTTAQVMHASGVLLAKAADGTVRVLKPRSAIHAGDTLMTQARSHAQVKLADETRVILQPGTHFSLSQVPEDSGEQQAAAPSLRLQQGGIRVTAGLLNQSGKRLMVLTTPAGKVEMEQGSVVVQYRPESASAIATRRAWLLASSAALDIALPQQSGVKIGGIKPLTLAQANAMNPPGLYVHVLDGMVIVSNASGAQTFAAGQFGYTASLNRPPVVLPANPGLQFTPPPSFSSQVPNTGRGNAPQSVAVDCEVR